MTELTTKVLPRECFGTVVTTRAVADQLPSSLLMRLLDKHFANDWGDLDDEDAQVNADAINACEGRIMSNYSWPRKLGLKENVWVITYLQSDPELQKSPDHCNTTVLFPSEY